jgi:very-short-patch-repair endonuclease
MALRIVLRKQSKETEKDETLKNLGLSVMRIKDIQVKRKMHAVLSEINDFIDDWEKVNLSS